MAGQLDCAVTRAKFQALTGQAVLCGHKVLLMKPQTFMNLSGNAVGAAARFYHLDPSRVLVLYDDTVSPRTLAALTGGITARGGTVRAEREVPADLTYRQLRDLRKGGA